MLFSSLSRFVDALGWQLCGVMTRIQSAAQGSSGCIKCWHPVGSMASQIQAA